MSQDRMIQSQPKEFEPIESVMTVASMLFGLNVKKENLLELCYIPMGEIACFHIDQCKKRFIVRDGCIDLNCKTFYIHSVMVASDCNISPEISIDQYNYINNPLPLTEYVSYNDMANWTNLFDKFGNYVGKTQDGKYYDKYNQLVGPAMIDEYREIHASSGGLYNVPINYRIEGKCLKFENKEGVEVQVTYECLIDDERGYPLIDEKTKTAIAYYMNMAKQIKKYFNGEIPEAIMRSAQNMYTEKVAQARSQVKLNENMKEKILKILTSYDRSSYKADYFE